MIVLNDEVDHSTYHIFNLNQDHYSHESLEKEVKTLIKMNSYKSVYMIRYYDLLKSFMNSLYSSIVDNHKNMFFVFS